MTTELSDNDNDNNNDQAMMPSTLTADKEEKDNSLVVSHNKEEKQDAPHEPTTTATSTSALAVLGADQEEEDLRASPSQRSISSMGDDLEYQHHHHASLEPSHSSSHTTNNNFHHMHPTSNHPSGGGAVSSSSLASVGTPRHSDFTVPTSNRWVLQQPPVSPHHSSPPMRVVVATSPQDSSINPTTRTTTTSTSTPKTRLTKAFLPFTTATAAATTTATSALQVRNASGLSSSQTSNSNSRRNIFGTAVEQRYQTTTDFSPLHPPPPPPTSNHHFPYKNGSTTTLGISELTRDLPNNNNEHHQFHNNKSSKTKKTHKNALFATTHTTMDHNNNHNGLQLEPLVQSQSHPHHHHHHHHHHHSSSEPSSHQQSLPRQRPHETIHAQALLLGLAFCAVWSPSNVMAPNLTELADFFGFDAAERDLYLGSYGALATGVFSFPIGAGIGILADVVPNRRDLYCATLLGGALAAYATGQAHNYPQFIVGRLVNGGFMAGSVPVAFSFLGDLFAVEERNAASSGLTAMMGLGIILGQVYAGTVGPTLGWQHAFTVSAVVTLVLAVICYALVQEPERGGKERVLQDMIRAGTRYERKLSWQGFWHACLQNASNSILLWQGFFSSLPWGVIFVFLNDYLSQERGFSVPAATFLVFLFGLGCAAGGVLGGYWGQVVQGWNRRYLPLFMALTTELGIVPFCGMLNVRTTRAHGPLGVLFAFGSGLIASLPSVNVRPCLINVNPPETRGAALTAANLLIQLGRGMGPSCVTLLMSSWGTDNNDDGTTMTRQTAINMTLIVFWTISSLQLLFLSKTLPKDQDSMEAELAKYAALAIEQAKLNQQEQQQQQEQPEAAALSEGPDKPLPVLINEPSQLFGDHHPEAPTTVAEPGPVVVVTTPSSSSLFRSYPPRDGSTSSTPTIVADQWSVEVSIEDRMTYFDGRAVNQTLDYVRQGIREFQQELTDVIPVCHACATIVESSSSDCSSSSSGSEDGSDQDEENDQEQNEPNLGQTQAEQNGMHSNVEQTTSLYRGVPPTLTSMSSTESTTEPTERTRLLPQP